jgi:hypothetical protein
MAKTSQLDLFATRDEVRTLEAENAWLRARLDSAKTEFRKLREELHQQARTATQEQQRLKRELRGTTLEVTRWKCQAEIYKLMAGPGGHDTQPTLTAPSKADLTRLLVLCHPDKWAQGQPATALAHEVTVQLNALRTRLEGQP